MSNVEPNCAYWILFGVHWLLYFFDQWIKWRQYQLHVRTKTCPPEIRELITDVEFAEGRKCALKIDKFNFIKDFVVHLAFMAFFFSGILPVIWKWIEETNTFRSIIIVLVVIFIFLIPFIIDWTIYKDKSKSGYDTDSLMWLMFGETPRHSTTFARGMLIFAFAVWFSRKVGKYFYVYLWAMASFFIILNVLVVYTFSFILAKCLFEKTEIPESGLKQQIILLAARCNHPVTKIFLSDHKTKSNRYACMYGLPSNKRIAIFSNLIKHGSSNIIFNGNEDGSQKESPINTTTNNNNLTTNEILAILAHEISFWNSRLPLFLLFIGIPYLYICYILLALLYQDPYLFETFGFPSTRPDIIGIIITLAVIFPIFNRPIARYIRTYFRRRGILVADEFAAKYGYSEALITALIKLNKDNKQKDVFPINDVVYSKYFCPHPSIFDRILLLKRRDNDNQAIQMTEINSN